MKPCPSCSEPVGAAVQRLLSVVGETPETALEMLRLYDEMKNEAQEEVP